MTRAYEQTNTAPEERTTVDRRAVLSGFVAGAAVGAGIASATASAASPLNTGATVVFDYLNITGTPSGALMQFAREVEDARLAMNRPVASPAEDPTDAELNALGDKWRDACDRFTSIPAQTLADFVVKAKAARDEGASWTTVDGEAMQTFDENIVRSILGDLLALESIAQNPSRLMGAPERRLGYPAIPRSSP